MHVFRVVDVQPGHSLTAGPARTRGPFPFGRGYGTYAVVPRRERARIVVKVAWELPGGVWGAVLRPLLPWADLVMMRKQLLRLRAYAERSRPPDQKRSGR